MPEGKKGKEKGKKWKDRIVFTSSRFCIRD